MELAAAAPMATASRGRTRPSAHRGAGNLTSPRSLILAVTLWCCCTGGRGDLSLQWTSYSDAAELPLSKQWRDEMRSRMSSIDTSKLSPREKMQFKTLWRRLDTEESHGGSDPVGTVERDWKRFFYAMSRLFLYGGIMYAGWYWLQPTAATSGGRVLGSQ